MSVFDIIKDLLGGGEKTQADQDRERGILPASQDPLGDPADQQGYRNRSDAEQGILPASMDPLGDPADQEDRARGILPASEDPLGDPADQPVNRRSRR